VSINVYQKEIRQGNLTIYQQWQKHYIICGAHDKFRKFIYIIFKGGGGVEVLTDLFLKTIGTVQKK
jgi:hypothetical protein